ncbi:hypothetical protein [Mycolicibacterium pulveris]|uniref:hypothetical protein n=1 Tax=Mycolicibacterium pulveris TaxID=36813 RepID=UPI003CF6F9D5
MGAVLLLPGCGSSDEPQSTVTVTEPAPVATTSPNAPTTEQQAPQTGAAAPARPARDQCVRIEPAPDGRYQVFDAGSAVVTFADGRLTLESATPADGWTHRVDDQEPEEVEIAFRRDAEELDLELEVDDGRLEVKICNDGD